MIKNEIILSQYEKLRVESYGDAIIIFIDDLIEGNPSKKAITVMTEDFSAFCQAVNMINDVFTLEKKIVKESDKKHESID
jgi:hypothetical protein